MRTRLAAALLAGFTLAGISCSSESTTTATPTTTVAATTTTAAMTKAEFIAAGNAICKDMNTKSAAISATLPAGKPTTNADLAMLFTKNADLISLATEQLKALPQPAGDESTLTAMYADVDAMVALSRRATVAYSSDDAVAIGSISSEGDVLQTKANASANAYGLTECGKGG